MQYLSLDFIGLFVLFAGFIIGLGAVTVIDLHGFLGRKSEYWTEATTRTHKVTKPLIWIGMFLAVVGGLIFYRNIGITDLTLVHIVSAVVMVLNGIFLSFSVSPFLLKKESEGRARELLPASWQIKITISFIISFICWWGNLALVVHYLSSNI
jgi:hypothetical protein